MEHDKNNRVISQRLREEALDLELFEQAKNSTLDYMQNILDQSVFPDKKAIEGLNIFREPLPMEPANPYDILQRLH